MSMSNNNDNLNLNLIKTDLNYAVDRFKARLLLERYLGKEDRMNPMSRKNIGSKWKTFSKNTRFNSINY